MARADPQPQGTKKGEGRRGRGERSAAARGAEGGGARALHVLFTLTEELRQLRMIVRFLPWLREPIIVKLNTGLGAVSSMTPGAFDTSSWMSVSLL